jgi:hypothetical protein
MGLLILNAYELSGFFMRFAAWSGTNGDDMQRVENIDSTALLLDDDIVPANKNKFRMWNRVFFSVGGPDNRWSRSAKAITDKVSVHH